MHIAYRRGCMKECISGGAFGSVVIDTFFGFSPFVDGKTMLADPQVSRPFDGELRHVAFKEGEWTLTASARGVKAKVE